MNALEELQELIEAHDQYAYKREKLEDKIKTVFSGNGINILSIVFTKKGFVVRVSLDCWVLDDISEIIENFVEFKISLEYKGDCAMFEFEKKED